MPRESKVELLIREAITEQLRPGETLREYTWGVRDSFSAARFLFGSIGAALVKDGQPGFYVGLTDRSVILLEVKGGAETGETYRVPLSDIKGFQYLWGAYAGTLNIHLTADIMKLIFEKRPWWSRAKNMAKLMPLPK